MKDRHDKNIQPSPKLEIGDKVLVYRASMEYNKSVKLEPKWKGPFYIYEVLPKNVFKLRTIEGKVISSPINVKLLKNYHCHANT